MVTGAGRIGCREEKEKVLQTMTKSLEYIYIYILYPSSPYAVHLPWRHPSTTIKYPAPLPLPPSRTHPFDQPVNPWRNELTYSGGRAIRPNGVPQVKYCIYIKKTPVYYFLFIAVYGGFIFYSILFLYLFIFSPP